MILTSNKHLIEAEQFLSSVDPIMAKLITQFGPCQISPWKQSLFPSLIDAIISQQLSVKAADTISGRVRALMPGDNNHSPEVISKLSVDELRQCGLSGAKTRYCQTLATAVVEGELVLDELRTKDDDDILETLITYPGIGKWTAEMFLIFAIGSSDIISVGDLGLRRGMQFYLELEDYPTDDLFLSKSLVWRPWRSVASWYLWRLAG